MKRTNFSRKKSRKFSDFMYNVKAGHQKPIQNALIEKCNVSFTTYRKWVRGLTTPTKSHQNSINSVARSFGYGTVYLPTNVEE